MRVKGKKLLREEKRDPGKGRGMEMGDGEMGKEGKLPLLLDTETNWKSYCRQTQTQTRTGKEGKGQSNATTGKEH
ncbi:hypothetical protein WR25_21932 [Diploscapter pachys]|uniref:Uncharacterized protein n=1 Tax=Diploscapter pachys TaxID=2018661 RepID=A0A2A2KYC2_9BILA|nr:hypothetical protein WR25_21932 [Diploscapter pachys]